MTIYRLAEHLRPYAVLFLILGVVACGGGGGGGAETGGNAGTFQLSTTTHNVTEGTDAAVTITVTTDVTPAPGDVPTLLAADQPATKRQIIRADASRIAVVIV